MQMPVAHRSPADSRPLSSRSRTTNRLRIPGLDGRTAVARRFRDLADAYARTIATDRPMTDDEAAAVLKAASLTAMCEAARAKAMKGRRTDVGALVRLEGVADRAVRALDKMKRAKPSRRSLAEYIAAQSGKAADAPSGAGVSLTMPDTDGVSLSLEDEARRLRNLLANPLLLAERRAGDAEARRTLEAAAEQLAELERRMAA